MILNGYLHCLGVVNSSVASWGANSTKKYADKNRKVMRSVTFVWWWEANHIQLNRDKTVVSFYFMLHIIWFLRFQSLCFSELPAWGLMCSFFHCDHNLALNSGENVLILIQSTKDFYWVVCYFWLFFKSCMILFLDQLDKMLIVFHKLCLP